MIEDLENIKKEYNSSSALELDWDNLKWILYDVNGNCLITREPVKIKVIDKHNRTQFTNSKVYITDNKLKGNERDISLVIRIEDNN